MFKKTWLKGVLLASMPVAVSLTALSAGCNNSAHPKKPSVLVSDVEPNEALKLTAEQVQNMPKVAVITDGGELTDKSFNQSSWEGLIKFGEFNELPFEKYGVYEVKSSQFMQMYEQALTDGVKIFVLPGFHHQDHVKAFYAKHKAEVDAKGIIFVGLDFGMPAEIPAGRAISIEFLTKEGAFIAGYALAQYLSEVFPGAENAAKRTFSTFGGGAFPGVTDFNEGLYKGVMHFNSLQTDVNKKVSSNDANPVILNTGFNANDNSKVTQVSSEVIDRNGTAILPVAGPFTSVVVKNENFKSNKDRIVIGVDSNQALSESKEYRHRFFSSILKNLGQAVFDTVSGIILNKPELLGGFVDGRTNGTLVKGVADNWVGTAPTNIEGTNKAIAEKALNDAKAVFSSLDATTKEWLMSNKVQKDGQEVNDHQERINQLSAATKITTS
ncbi:BMP family ABC transporter substrate-binding protein [Mycoplasmopsis gallinarum]